jgi:sugar (pentulose or hexulose) kinase
VDESIASCTGLHRLATDGVLANLGVGAVAPGVGACSIGTSAAIGDPYGALLGLTQRHGRAHVVQAALEGVCLQPGLVLDTMRAAGLELAELRATRRGLPAARSGASSWPTS